ncbi:efflux RND transporter periplasmic adaptor subunit [Bradyrhizobium genosp. P]|uniref:efflux RND transporter periplasmic adaptor subunit n=1 Tax=Bradyrhizobium genosp. P TaxID=83641 RepID=UPI003CF737CD
MTGTPLPDNNRISPQNGATGPASGASSRSLAEDTNANEDIERGLKNRHTLSSGRRRKLLVAFLLIAASGAAATSGFKNSSNPTVKPLLIAAIPVTAVKASTRDLPIERSGLGTVLPLNQVDVKVRADGQLQRIAFVEGQSVQAGDLLAEIDPRPYQAQLAAAQATLKKDMAQLASDQAEDTRAAKLSLTGAGTGQAADKAKAQVAIMQATLMGDQAAVDTATINLGYTNITSPISGRVGLKQINEGAVVHASDASGLVTLTQIHPIAVEFSLPQDELPDLLSGQAKASLPVTIYSRDGSRQLATGKLTVIDSQVDTSTGMVKLKAEFGNDDSALWPGQLVTARVIVKTDRNATIVPSAAIQNGQDGPYLFIVKPDATVARTSIKSGPAVGDVTALLSGVKPGENVVVSGQSRLTQGTAVSVTQADTKTASTVSRTE